MVIGKDGKNEQRENLGGDVDSGSPQTLVDFVRWSKEKAPADRYALVIWNHGSGWDPLDFDELYSHVKSAGVTRTRAGRARVHPDRPQPLQPTIETALTRPNARLRAIASDDGTGHSLDTLELGNVLKQAHEVLGRPVDLLGMDACLMSCLEVAYQAEKDVRAVVSSEELEPGDGWPYEKILADLRSNPTLDGAGLGRVVVKRYVESYKHAEASGRSRCARSTARGSSRSPTPWTPSRWRCGGRSRTTTSTPPAFCGPTRAARASTAS